MPSSDFKKLYSKSQLEDDSNYLPLSESAPYFHSLRLKNPLPRLRQWLKNGMLVGRLKNVSVNKTPYANQWEVFVPDIPRFKKEIYS